MATPNRAKRPILLIMVAVLVWGVYLSVGAFRFDWSVAKGLIVFATVATFLALWAVLLVRRGFKE